MLIAGVFVLYALYYHLVARMPGTDFGWRYIAWPLPWFGGLGCSPRSAMSTAATAT